VSYVDDTVVVVEASAEQLGVVVGQTCCILQDVFEARGLPINYGPGKSEVVLGFHGPQARVVRLQITHEQQGRISFVHNQESVHILVSDVYKHLGAHIGADGCVAPEVNYRIQRAWATVGEHAKGFYKNRDFDSDVKAATEQPLLLSQLLHNAPTWAVLKLGQAKRVNGTFLKVVHMVANAATDDYQNEWANLAALDKVKMLPLEVTVRLQRLAYLPRLMMWAPSFLLLLLDDTPSYRNAVVSDLVWLAAQTTELEAMPEPHVDLAAWLDVCRVYGPWWENVVRRTRAASLARQHEAAAAAAAADPEDIAIASLVAGRPAVVCCYECGSSFANANALRMHTRKAHGHRAATIQAAHGTACLCCLKQFHSLGRLLQHLHHVNRCCRLTIWNVPPLPLEEIEKLRVAERLHVRQMCVTVRRTLLPVIRLQGPLPEWATETAGDLAHSYGSRLLEAPQTAGGTVQAVAAASWAMKSRSSRPGTYPSADGELRTATRSFNTKTPPPDVADDADHWRSPPWRPAIRADGESSLDVDVEDDDGAAEFYDDVPDEMYLGMMESVGSMGDATPAAASSTWTEDDDGGAAEAAPADAAASSSGAASREPPVNRPSRSNARGWRQQVAAAAAKAAAAARLRLAVAAAAAANPIVVESSSDDEGGLVTAHGGSSSSNGPLALSGAGGGPFVLEDDVPSLRRRSVEDEAWRASLLELRRLTTPQLLLCSRAEGLGYRACGGPRQIARDQLVLSILAARAASRTHAPAAASVIAGAASSAPAAVAAHAIADATDRDQCEADEQAVLDEDEMAYRVGLGDPSTPPPRCLRSTPSLPRAYKSPYASVRPVIDEASFLEPAACESQYASVRPVVD